MADGVTEPAPDGGAEGAEYRFERLTTGLVLRDMYYARGDPGPGDRVPDFDLQAIDGGRFRSDDLADAGATLLVFGSYTCPVTESSAAGLRSLHAQFGDRIRFVMVNVREAHPGEHVPQPHEASEKEEHARVLRDHHEFPFEVAVGEIDGTLHRALGPKPNSAYLLGADGSILFRAHWANDTRRLRGAVSAVAEGRALRKGKSDALVGPMMKVIGYVDPILETAGPRSRRDMWRAAAPMAIMARLTRLFPFLPPERRGPAVIAALSVVAVVIAAVLVLAL
jgi:hypothetical protein